ncbi:MAG: hypothetical protein OXE04_07370 [bacterium]|nr:hypothetical protein [bacterium]MCY4258087.1 hypothetical protein [bacterium]
MNSGAVGSSTRYAPDEARPTLVWEVMGRLDDYERRQRRTRRWLAGAGLAAATWLARRRTGRN